MADSDTAVTVFVDDAVLGRFPGVCARTGRPSDGWLTIDSAVTRSGWTSTPVPLLLLFVGPIGWFALLLFGSDRSEHLTVQVPWTVDTQDRVVALRRRRRTAWAVTVAGVVAWIALVVRSAAAVDGMTMSTRVVVWAIVIASATALVVALATEWRIGRETVRVELDASRRWVTLRNVHPAFSRAALADQDRRGYVHR